jgi:hypothetical protein
VKNSSTLFLVNFSLLKEEFIVTTANTRYIKKILCTRLRAFDIIYVMRTALVLSDNANTKEAYVLRTRDQRDAGHSW